MPMNETKATSTNGLWSTQLFNVHIGIWCLYFIGLWIVPQKSEIDPTAAYIHLLLFLAITVVSFLAINQYLNRNYKFNDQPLDQSGGYKIFLILSLIGLFFHLYDKIFIMNIDYTQGICSAKSQWVDSAEKRGHGISSIWSFIGHILFNLHFAFFYRLIMDKKFENSFKYVSLLVFQFFLILVYSASIGNRSVILFVVCYVATLLLLKEKKELGLIKYLWKLRPFFISLFVVSGAYFLYVFHDRARCESGSDSQVEVTEANIKRYQDSFNSVLGADKSVETEKSIWYTNKLTRLLNLSILYTVHTQWTFALVLAEPERTGSNLINSPLSWLTKLNLIGPLPNRTFSSRLLHLPGSVFYSFDFFGFYIFAMLFGGLMAATSFFRNKNIFSQLAYIMVGLFTLIAPLTSAANLMAFPFLLVALGAVLIQYFYKLKRG